MASKKEGGKNRKFGRHARNPSSANQAKRTERNKAERKQKIVHIPPSYGKHQLTGTSKEGRALWFTLEWKGHRARIYCA